MSSAVADLEASLQAMLQLKPPGVSGSRISSITNLCTANIESESVLIQKLYTHFKKAPATHKLGVLYVVDSVTRKWSDGAKNAGQALDGSAVDGTYGAGVNRVKELLPSLMNDIIQSAPHDQKDKIRKLVDIWEKSQTFPLQMLVQFKEKLDAIPSKPFAQSGYQGFLSSSDSESEYVAALSTTPEGSPPQIEAVMSGTQQPNESAAPVPDTNAILAVLANMAKQNATPANDMNAQQQHSSYTPAASGAQAVPQNVAPVNQHLQSLPLRPGVDVSAAPNGNYAPQYQGHNNGVQNGPSNSQTNTFAGQPMPVPNLAPLAGAVDPAVFQAQLVIVQALAAQGIPQEQWPAIIAAINSGIGGAGAAPASFPPQPPLPQFGQSFTPTPALNNGNAWSSTVKQEDARDRNGNGYNDGIRSPPNHFRRRSRSRSPQRNGGWTRDNASNRRGENNYDRNARGGRGNEYRQRSPAPRRSRTPPRAAGGMNPKWTDFDASLPNSNIKVLSRTLFVGGVTISEHELRGIFERLGKVQTCIVNKDKRHAFVKMVSRKDAESAKLAMEKNHSVGGMRTRWGVGFGPRDCSDYQTGISVIPIDKLTEADRKWMLTAEYGGTGGAPIEGGLVVEEPDIEIGQGVSSKAISRRMQTDNGGQKGPKSGRDFGDDHRGHHHDRRNDFRRNNDDRNTQTVTAPPAVPGFQFPFTFGPNGMPIFPPNFNMQNGSGQSQPPGGPPGGPPGYRG